MSSSTAETLVRMANQITKFFHPQGEERAVAGVADHLMKFWEPRMKDGIFAHMDAGGAGLDPWTLKALEKLRADVEAKKKAAAGKPAPVPGPKKVAQPAQQAKAKASAGRSKASKH
jgi:formate dehydrogenase subunit delta